MPSSANGAVNASGADNAVGANNADNVNSANANNAPAQVGAAASALILMCRSD
jgi:hypothetical protein